MPPLSDELILGLLAKESSSRADNAAILEYFNEHSDLAERSAFCKHCYKQIYTYLFVDDHTVGFIRHDMYLELWEGNYLTKTAQVNLTWDAVAAKIADLIEQGRLMVPIKAAPVPQQIDSSDSAYWAVQENINAIRAAAGLSPLAMDGGLSAAADARCESFVAGGAFDHSGMTTRSEICAAGPIGSASSVCSYWQNSPAHYANITNASFTSMGVACWFCSTAEGQYTYWTVTFN